MPEITSVLKGFLSQLNDQRCKQLVIISFSPFSLCSLEPSVNHFIETDNGDIDDKKLYIPALRRSL